MKKNFLSMFLILFLGGAFGLPVEAFEVKETYPKIADYYLQPLIPKDHYDDLAKYDLLVLDVDTQTIDASLFSQIKKDNPDIKFLAYIPSQSVNTQDLSSWARFRRMNYDKVNNNDWWLKDSSGKTINLSGPWPTIKFVDLGKGWSEYLSSLIEQDVLSRDIWDGVFYDMVFANIDWLNNGDIDINQDGQPDDANSINQYWQKHINDLLNQTKSKVGSDVLVINLDKINSYENGLNGVMAENFPSPHLNDSGWSGLINYYLNQLPLKTESPQIYIINANTDNTGAMDSYREMRFGLTSTLLGDGYYSFDHGDQTHSQVWWYDEYNENLGRAESSAYNLLDKNNQEIKPGLWRRDFENGLAVINSTNQKLTYAFDKEEFETINGNQDRRVNNGTKVNWVSLEPEDGIVLLKIKTKIEGSSFINGNFVRVFNEQGSQVRNGFFAFKDNFPGQSRILITDLDNDGVDETLISHHGKISIYQDGRMIRSFAPYDFSGQLSFAVGDLNGDGLDEIITGAGPGGGPHVKVLTQKGLTLNEFMAYNEDLKSGITVMSGDLDKNDKAEIFAGTVSF